MIPLYLLSTCLDNHDVCRANTCQEAVKQNPESKRFYITMGHAGFNTRVNNEEGYVSEHAARMVMTRCLYR